MIRRAIIILAGIGMLAFCACSHAPKKQNKDTMKLNGYSIGSYGYDAEFLKSHDIEYVELTDDNAKAKIMVIPGLQGRVMTSSANGDEGLSFGWINYDLINKGEKSKQFNPFGGEERFWLGPEGGPFSIYFKEGDEQVFENWVVPSVLDTESYQIKELSSGSVSFEKNTKLKNASGTEFKVAINRTVSLIGRDQLYDMFYVDLPEGAFDVTAYQSENTITNMGENAWTEENGLLSIWLLSMFNPSPETTVFIPYETDAEGKIVNDEYFGKVPSDRLIVENGTVFFKIDGKYRSKIGLPPERAKGLCGSFDASTNVLTLLWCSSPDKPGKYVNSQWGDQDDPYAGDMINSYNDGPVDGKTMGPFYEIETSSPAADLKPGESLTHIQRIVHIQGEKVELAKLVNKLFNLNLFTIESKFKSN